MDEDKIMQKLLEHDEKFAEHGKQSDRIIDKLIKHDEQFERLEIKVSNLMTKDDGEKIMKTLDTVVTMVKKIQEDDVAKSEWLKRLQKNDERQDKDIQQITVQLKMA